MAHHDAQARRSIEEQAQAMMAVLSASMLTQASMGFVQDLLKISDWLTTEERTFDE